MPLAATFQAYLRLDAVGKAQSQTACRQGQHGARPESGSTDRGKAAKATWGARVTAPGAAIGGVGGGVRHW